MRFLIATVAGGVLWLLGAGLHPVSALTWLAPLPVLLFALRAGPWPGYAAAAGSWLIGQAGLLSYYLGDLEIPPVLVVAMALFGAGLLAATVAVARGLIRRGRVVAAVWTAPAVWVLGEYVVSRLLPHGAWWSLGYTQAEQRGVVQLAALTGVWGITYVLLAVPVALAAASRRDHRRRAVAGLLTIILLTGGWAVWRLLPVGPAATEPAAMPGSGDLAVQGNGAVAATEPAAVPGSGDLAARGNGAVAATEPAAAPDLITIGLAVVPQTGDPVDPDTPAGTALLSRYRATIDALARAGARVIVLPEKVFKISAANAGTVARELAHPDARVLAGVESEANEAILIGPGGVIVARYAKRRLIPGLEDHLRPGTGPVTHGSLALAVCKDLDFPELVRGYARDGAGVLLAPSWDFGRDGWLHSRMALVRGVESGLSVVRPARWGQALVSDRTGRIVAGAVTGTDPTAIRTATPSTGSLTPYARVGDWFPAVCVLLLVAQIRLRRRLAAAAEHHLPRAVGEELDAGQLPPGELGLNGELRRRGQTIDIRRQP
ncbi:apolipoprotein N-acyltransferase [Actinoplanes sichuanensis]|nr:apolipoprotein N-acyltransferase [Actinoplanes sichuanensis]